MSSLVRWLWAPFIAVQFMTRLPIRFIPSSAFEGADAHRRAVAFFPLVGVLVAAIIYGAMLLGHRCGMPSTICAILGIAASVITTGCFHEDGLADTADALGTYTRDDALIVMRDSRIGTFGSVALWVALTLKAATLSALPLHHLFATLLVAHVLARWSSLPLAFALPYAREGAGLGSDVAGTIGRRELLLGTVIAAALTVPFVAPMQLAYSAIGTVILTSLCGVFFAKRFGGVTGDCLGAANQLVEVKCLLIGLWMVAGR